jgi:pyochelin synthetase
LHAGFFALSREQPSRIAVDDPSREVTYGELAAHASSVAFRLREAGVRPGDLVAVVMEKGWEQIAGVLGILRAGGAYLPMDPSLPKARLDYLLSNGRVSVVLTQERLRSAILWPDTVNVWTVEEDSASAGAYDGPDGLPDSLAYVIYTSGSSGMPKGVMITHEAALNTIVDINRRLDISASDRVLAISALSFDLSVYDIFGILERGGTIVLPAPDRSRDPVHWLERMNEAGVTIWNSAPALMQMLVTVLESSPIQLLARLRWIMLSGDWIPIELPGRLRRFVPDCQILGLGGATEVSIWSIAHQVEKIDPLWTSIPYGMPLTNQTIHVLDENYRPCPEGTPGEIFIGGDGLALGYFADEARTAQSFAPSPITGERLYRTGDFGRFRAEGFVEFLGRKDTQVKIRGYRIEIGEVEAALARLPRVRESAVLVAPGASTENSGGMLVACVILDQAPSPNEPPPDENGLREKLGDLLPAHMVPSRIIVLDQFPLSSNGKVDRRKLLESILATVDATENRPEDEPRDFLEVAIRNIWQEVFPGRRIGRNDRFYDFGGDSMTVLQMMARVEKMVGRKMGLRPLHNGGTIADIAAAARETGPVASPSLMNCAQPGDSLTPFFFAHGDLENGGLYCQRLAPRLGADQPFYSIAPHGTFGGPLPSSFEEIATDYVALIRSIQPMGPYCLGGYCNGAMAMYEASQQLTRAGETVSTLILLDPPDLYFFLLRQRISRFGKLLGLSESQGRNFYQRTAEGIEIWRDEGAVGLLKAFWVRWIAWLGKLAKGLFGKKETGDSGPNLNFHYYETIASYKLQNYRGFNVWILLRREDLELYVRQVQCWTKFIPRALYHGISGSHLELKESMGEIAEIISTALHDSTKARMERARATSSRGKSPSGISRTGALALALTTRRLPKIPRP